MNIIEEGEIPFSWVKRWNAETLLESLGVLARSSSSCSSFFLEVSCSWILYITIYILNSYKQLEEAFVSQILIGTTGTGTVYPLIPFLAIFLY